ncbi:MAG: hypothetical protein EZS28_019628 [Streblomastix strix]|uniref:Uncharacterized protein n=1 Tax=Streblomastix strix TaxID=222440 RepID=A0A5J4VQC7_9EUKA|nr:MAG: hypothetical protein EZS28_019628 [Streblomastix strix]
MMIIELLTGRNAFAIDFSANTIAQAPIQYYNVRTLHAPEITCHAEVPLRQILNNAANSRVDGFIQNLQFQILMLHKLTIFSIQHVLEGNTSETLNDLVDMCAAILRFVESHVTRNSTIACVETDTSLRKSRPLQPASRPILRNSSGTRAIDSTAGDVYTNLDYIAILFRTSDTKTIDIITIPGIQHVPGNVTILRFSVTKPFLIEPIFFRLQYLIIQTAKHHGRLTVVHVEPSNLWIIINSIIQFINSTSIKLSGASILLIELPELESQSQAQEPVYSNGRQLDSPGTDLKRKIAQDQQPLWNQEISQRTDQSLFTRIDPQNQRQI